MQLGRFLVAVLCVSISGLPATQSATLVVHHNANFRQSATTQSAILEHLVPGDELTLIGPAQTAGFYHVRTMANIEGWVYRTLVHIEEADTTEAVNRPWK